jgi:FKBP-type peptidyl-prolyl cis-trans isomerase
MRCRVKRILVAVLMGLMFFAVEASAEMITTDSGLRYEDHKVGMGTEAAPGDRIEVHYSGWLSREDQKGRKFDSSVDRGRPFSFILGTGRVIKGWDEGVAGMKVGGTRTLYIPSELGYGSAGAGRSIPPNADLIFEVELLSIK